MKYFGTDGFRGHVNQQLNPMHAFQIGQFLGDYFRKLHPTSRPKVIIGKDTRLSGDVLEHALASGAASSGCDAYFLGVCPTPAVSYQVRYGHYDFGVMISASHNPYMDNGIKVFNALGFKLEEEIELQIERFIDGEIEVPWAGGDALGRIYEVHKEGLLQYADWLLSLISTRFTGLTVVLDLANGSATSIAKEVIERAGAKTTVISSEANGFNINENCGSTHLHQLQEAMRSAQRVDVGLAFDGDADRLLAVDDEGCVVDGDVIMYLCAKHMMEQGLLEKNTLVTTVMSNLGLFKALNQIGVNSEIVQVGDKYVSQCMFDHGYVLGGEQSGHIIFGRETVTGDGLLTALHLLEVIHQSGKKLSELVKEIEIYPQLLKNVKVLDKQAVLEDIEVCAMTEKIKSELADNGRVLVRASGTEQLIRVMVEAKTAELCDNYVSAITNIIEKKGL